MALTPKQRLAHRAAVVARRGIRTPSKTSSKKPLPNPSMVDPTRTITLRRVFAAKLQGQFDRLARAIVKLVVDDDAFGINADAEGVKNPLSVFRLSETLNSLYGVPPLERDETGGVGPHPYGTYAGGNSFSQEIPTGNTKWRFKSSPEKLKEFQGWLETQYGKEIASKTSEELWKKYIEEGYKKGAARAFDDTRKIARPDLYTTKEQASLRDFYSGTKEESLRSAFAQPISQDRLKMLAARAFDDLKGLTTDQQLKLSRILGDGLTKGDNPKVIARALVKEVGIGANRAKKIAATEVIRAHAEGQLTTLEEMGVEALEVKVEWSAAANACPKCAVESGKVFSIKEARGMIPFHPFCRCAWIPAPPDFKGKKGKKPPSTKEKKAAKEAAKAEPKEKVKSAAELQFDEAKARVDKLLGGTDFPPRPPHVSVEGPVVPSDEVPYQLGRARTGQAHTEATVKQILADDKYGDYILKVMDTEAKWLAEMEKRMTLIGDRGRELQSLSYELEGQATRARGSLRDRYRKLADEVLEFQEKKLLPYMQGEREYIREHGREAFLRHAAVKDPANLSRSPHSLGFSGDPAAETVAANDSAIEFLNKVTSKGATQSTTNEFVLEELRPGGRAHYSNGLSQVSVALDDSVSTHIHELAHYIEYRSPGVQSAAGVFRDMNSSGPVTELAKAFPGRGYAPGEVARLTKFKAFAGGGPGDPLAWYAGRIYGHEATEIVSLGVEMMYNNPVHFAKVDPEYFKFILNVLRGKFS